MLRVRAQSKYVRTSRGRIGPGANLDDTAMPIMRTNRLTMAHSLGFDHDFHAGRSYIMTVARQERELREEEDKFGYNITGRDGLLVEPLLSARICPFAAGRPRSSLSLSHTHT